MNKRKKENLSWKEEAHDAVAAHSKIVSFKVTMKSLRELAEKEAKLVQCALRDMENNLIDPKYILELTKSIHSSGERSISDYINRNTEILLNEHASVVRQQVIQNMKLQIEEMNKEVTNDAEKLEEDVSSFLELVQSSYISASESFKRVMDLAKNNYNKTELIKETKDKLFSLQNEVQKLEQQLLECLVCAAFIYNLFPEKYDGKSFFISKEFLKSFGPEYSLEKKISVQKEVIDELLKFGNSFDPVDVHIESADEVLKVIDRLKDSNLSLVRNSHLSKGSSKFETKEIDEAKKKMQEELKVWDIKISDAEKEVVKAKESYEKLVGQMKELEEDDSQKDDKRKREIEMKKIADIYRLCTGSDVKNVDITLMKAAIDHCVEDLLQEIRKFPKRKIREILKMLEVEKKQSERRAEEALRAQRLKQRLQKAVAPATKKKSKLH